MLHAGPHAIGGMRPYVPQGAQGDLHVIDAQRNVHNQKLCACIHATGFVCGTDACCISKRLLVGVPPSILKKDTEGM
jgi:hypothetical protein